MSDSLVGYSTSLNTHTDASNSLKAPNLLRNGLTYSLMIYDAVIGAASAGDVDL